MMHVLLNWLNRRQTSKETQRMFESLLSLAWIVEAKDPYTGGHLWRVSQLAHTVALADKWTHEDRAAVTAWGVFT
ncbi:hypothetical protein [Salinivibrio socompensis]|uniref:hypothetical protein n=1 Tax=Salinivibrio socompensis TaxID=1510206 RepID=UPI000687F329|nr:hypothetical protein [Salinivibrio socompensis]